jgi:hypothetical protein
MMVNASLFIGQLLSQRNPVLEELIPKFLSQIFSTFVLRFMTCFDPKVQAQSYNFIGIALAAPTPRKAPFGPSRTSSHSQENLG